MFAFSELRSVSEMSCSTKPRLFFNIYYDTGDQAFEKAAQTWEKEIRGYVILSGHDVFVSHKVSTEAEFTAAWNEIFNTAWANKMQVFLGTIFSHTSKGDTKDGLEFEGDDPKKDALDGTLTMQETMKLKILPWHERGVLVLTGCNTGLGGKRGKCPAEAFRDGQRCSVIGQVGYAYFSQDFNSYKETTNSSPARYLWAYKRGKNGAVGGGQRLQGRIFRRS